MSVFIIEHLYKSYVINNKKHNVLNNINISLPDCGLVSIVGKSGSGKSTLLNILAAIEKPTKGSVLFNNKNIFKFSDKKYSEYHLTGVSVIFQHYNLFDNLSALENAMLPLNLKHKKKSDSKNEVLKLFKKLGIENICHQKVENLSGGEKQRVAIVRSLVTNPKAILCDEPTGALDEKNSREIMDILKTISERTLVIMVSHNRQLVNEYSDQILTLKDGRIVDNLSTIKKRFSNKYAKEKYKYSSNWTNKFLRLNFKKARKKNIFSFLSSLISFVIIFLSIGFIAGSKESQDLAIKKNLGMCYSTISETSFIEIQNSPLTYQKTLRPKLEDIDREFNSFKSIRIEENLSYFISGFASCTFSKKNVQNFQMVPLFDETLITFGNDLLKVGKGLEKSYEEVLINTAFAELLKENNLLNRELVINNSAPVTYNTGDSNNPFIIDTLSYTKKFKIVGIVEEFSFLNSPCIYYSYTGAKNFLKAQRMDKLSNYKKKNISYYDFLKDCNPDDPICSYSYFLFLDGQDESDNFFEKVKDLKNNNSNLQVDSKVFELKETYTTFIDSFSSSLIIFLIIAFLGINFILGMLSFSSFIENKKETAIMTCLGARNVSIYNMYIVQNFTIILFSFLTSIFLSNLLQNPLNNYLNSRFLLEKLISIPFKSFCGIPYFLPIAMLFIFLTFSALFTLIPMSIYRHKSLSDELRDE